MATSDALPSSVISDLFSDLPPLVRTRTKSGFRALARMPTERLADVVEVAKKSIGVKRPPFEKYAVDLEVSPSEVTDILSAAALTSAHLLSARTVSAEEFARAVVENGLADEEHKAAIVNFAQIVLNQADSWRDSLNRSQIAAQIIPAFTELTASIDLRLQVQAGQVQDSVPVAILWLHTDMDDEEIIFQTTKEGIEEILNQLQDLKSQLETAEEWTRQRSLGGEGE